MVCGVVACGGDGSPSGSPDWATVKRLAESTPPVSSECVTGTKDQAQLPLPSEDPPSEKGSRFLQCSHSTEVTVHYKLYKSAADRDKAIKDSAVDMFGGPYFVNGGLLVFVVEVAPSPQSSPLAERIRRECECGEVRRPRGAP